MQLRAQHSQRLIKLQPMGMLNTDFRDELNLQDNRTVLSEIKAKVGDPKAESFWETYTNEVVEYLQNEIESSY